MQLLTFWEAPALGMSIAALAANLVSPLFRDRKVKCCACFHRAVGPRAPAVAMNDALDIRQAYARPFELVLAVQALKHTE
jgi:hypothetical protein